jgi:competence protein ComEC
VIGIQLGDAFLGGVCWGAGMLLPLAGLIVLFLLFNRRLQFVITSIAIVLAALLGVWRREPAPSVPIPVWADRAEAVSGRIVSVPAATIKRRRFLLEVNAVEQDRTWSTTGGRVLAWVPLIPAVRLGDEVVLTGQAVPANDYARSYRSYLSSRGAGGLFFANHARLTRPGTGWRRDVARFRHAVDARLQTAAPGEAGVLLAGLVTGDDQALADDTRQAFLNTGTTHLTAVSGSNLALLVVILAAAGRTVGWRKRLLWQTAMVVAVWGYATVTGFGEPVVRAALVATGALFASRFGRRADYVTLLVLAGALMVAVSPRMLWSLAFQLSFASSLALTLVLARLDPRSWRSRLWAAFVATAAAQVATLPVLVPVFGEFSLVTLPANLLIVPAVSIAFPLAVVVGAVGFASDALSAIVALPARLCVAYVFFVVERLANLPGAVLFLARPGALGRASLALLAVVAIGALSADVRQWAAREHDRVRTWRREAPWFALGMSVGIAAVPLALAVSR